MLLGIILVMLTDGAEHLDQAGPFRGQETLDYTEWVR